MGTLINAFAMIYMAIYQQSKDVIERLSKSETCFVIFLINFVLCWGLADIQAWIFKALTSR